MIDPIAFSGFGLEIRWYGIYYSIGFLLSYFYVMYFAKYFDLKKKFVEDVYVNLVLISVVGGRIFEILFYDLKYYLTYPTKIFAVWEGGMSIHGAIFFAVVYLIYVSRKNGISSFRLLDLFAVPASLGLAFGRLLNFVNQELVGSVTSSKLGVVFPLYDDKTRLPYQIFAGFKNLIVFNVLLYIQFFKKYKEGVITSWFLILYGFGRFFLDFIRVPTNDLGFIGMGQLLSLIMGFIGVYLLYRISFNNKK